ncbi:MAG: ABC transporter permease [Bacteroides sp.]|nr:ABC transporter permease [Bacteroides sp.]
MTKQILKQIWNERRSNAWLWIELLLVSVVLWVVVDWCYVMLYTYLQPRGFNIENTYLVRMACFTPKSDLFIPAEQKTTTVGEDILNILDRLRNRPDVEYVSISYNSFPYNDSNSHNNLKHDTIRVNRHRRIVTPDFFNVFQYQNVDGTGSQSLANALHGKNMIVSENFFPDEYADKELFGAEFWLNVDSTKIYRVGAVSKNVRYADFRPASNSRYFAIIIENHEFAAMNNTDIEFTEFCIRVRPDASPEFAKNLMKEAPRNYMVGNTYIKSVESFSDIREMFQRDTIKEVKNRAFIMFFLLANIFLGIIGTFWFRTQQRRSELGLRIALGSNSSGLQHLLLGEGLWILIFAFLPAIIICYNIGYADVTRVWQMEWGMMRFIPAIVVTFVLLALMIIAGIWYPAKQAMKIQPAEALHDE